MTLTINDATMTSDQTAHTARQAPGRQHLWEVSWLPGRALDRNGAITAMILADHAGEHDLNQPTYPGVSQVQCRPATTPPRPPAKPAKIRPTVGWPTPSTRPPA